MKSGKSACCSIWRVKPRRISSTTVNETARRIAAAKPFARPSSRYRETLFDVDEQLVSAWTEAARHLPRAADAPLPNGGVIEQRGHEIRGGEPPLSPRKRAQGGG